MARIGESGKPSTDLDVETISRAVYHYLELKRKTQRRRQIMIISQLLVVVDMLAKICIFALASSLIAVRIAAFSLLLPLTCWYGMILKKPKMMLPQIVNNVVIAICLDSLFLCIVFNVKDADYHLKDLAPPSFWLPIIAFGSLLAHTVEYLVRKSYDNLQKDGEHLPCQEEPLELKEYLSSAIQDTVHQEHIRKNNYNREDNLLPENPPVYSSRQE